MSKIITIDRCEDCKHFQLPSEIQKMQYPICTLKQKSLPVIVTDSENYTAPIPKWCPLSEAPHELTVSERAFSFAYNRHFGELSERVLIEVIEGKHDGSVMRDAYELWEDALEFASSVKV